MKQIIILLAIFLPISLLSQINETFSGPSITSENPWTGDLDEFYINTYGELEFASFPDEAGAASLSLTLPYSSCMTWEMETMMDFKPTNSNNARIHVYHSSQNSETESYYIQIGNNSGQVSLYRQGASNAVLCIAGSKYLLQNPYTRVYIRLTLEENKKWTLYTKTSQEEDFIKEGEYTRTIASPVSSGEFILTCRYIKSRLSIFYFNTISIYPSLPDENKEKPSLPELKEMRIATPETIELSYTGEVDIAEVTCEVSGKGYAESVEYGKDKQTLLLVFPFVMETGIPYELHIRGIRSMGGTFMPDEIWEFELEETETPEKPEPGLPPPAPEFSPGDLIINEVMADPKGTPGLPETEYVELFNKSEKEISLSDWVFYYGTQKVLLPEKIVPAGGYIVLYREGRDIYVEKGGMDFPLSNFPAALANTGKELALRDPAGNLIDEIVYEKATPGRSWERKGNGWYLSADSWGGTPGTTNSVPKEPDTPKPPDPEPEIPTPEVPEPEPPVVEYEFGIIIINEVMADPKGAAGLPETEYIELRNTGQEEVILHNWILYYGTQKVLLPEKIIPAGSYAVLYREGRSVYVEEEGIDLPLPNFPAALANMGKELTLEDAAGNLIDEVVYEKATPGKAWEREGDNWYLSTDTRGGTPGGINSLPEIPDNPEPPDPGKPQPELPEPSVIEYDSGAIFINEVMADPKGVAGLPETEYVELQNNTEEDISLYNWLFYYGTQKVLLPDKILPAGGYGVLYRVGREMYIEEDGIDLSLSGFPSALANTGKKLSLEDPAGNLIDEVVYEKATPGKSWERVGNSWYLSTDIRGGTPGAVNSTPEHTNPDNPEPPSSGGSVPEPFDIVFNELLPEPFPEGSEFIELYNRSGKSLAVSGLAVAVRKTDGTLATSYPLSSIGTVPEHNGYVVITKDKEGVLSFYNTPYEENIYEIKMPVLSNTSSTLVLFRIADQVVIDEISYSAKWHSTGILSRKGVSLERVDPDGETQDEKNWNSAAVQTGYATPGYQNSQNIDTKNEAIMELGKPVYHTDGSYSVLFNLDNSGYYCRAFLYSLSGVRQADIANHELTGTSGSLIWNGMGLNDRKLTTGLYLLYVEFYHPEGGSKKFKIPFPVR